MALCLFANQYTEDEEVSADIVQDSFAKLWQIRDDFFYLHQVKAFLYTAVRNKALNELEHSKVTPSTNNKTLDSNAKMEKFEEKMRLHGCGSGAQ